MIMLVLRLIHWEWFKLRKRWMPWILLIVALAVVQATLWGFYASYGNVGNEYASGYPGVPDARGRSPIIRITCADVLDGTAAAKAEKVSEEFREQARKTPLRRERCLGIVEQIAEDRERHREFFVLPGGLANALGVAHYIGLLLVMILGASTVGAEYGWGTLRTALTKGTGRWQFLGAKALSLVLFSVAGLLVVSLTVVVSSLIAASLTLGDGGGLAGAGQWSTVAVMFGKATYVLVAYAILALFLTVLTSSSSIGIAISMAYFFVELILIQVLGGLFDWFSTVTDFLLGPSIAGWMAQTGVQSNALIAEARVFTESGGLVRVSELPGQLQAFLVLIAYIIILGGAALWLIRRRDIAGAKGE